MVANHCFPADILQRLHDAQSAEKYQFIIQTNATLKVDNKNCHNELSTPRLQSPSLS